MVAVAAVAAAALTYAAFVVWLAARGQLGNDELFTLYFSRLPGINDVWRELATGVEQSPPFFYIVTRASLGLFGDNSVALRLPELVGVLLAAVCTLVAVARRSSLVYGVLAALLLLGSQATFYAREARPYGLVLGFVAAGFLCWQVRGDGRGGLLVVVAMTIALTAAVASQYYAVLALLPIVLGEGLRTIRRRRVDGPVLTGLGVSLLPLLVAVPLIDAARAYSGSFWTVFTWRSAVEFNSWLFRTSAVSGNLASRLGLSLLVWAVCGLALHALLTPLRRHSIGAEDPVASGSQAARETRLLAVLAVLAVAGAVTLRVLAGSDALSNRDVAYVAAGAVLVLAYGVVYRRRHAEIARRAHESFLPMPEIVAAAAFLFVPLVAVALAKISTGAYAPRYALPAALGVSLLLPLGLHRLEGKRKLAAALLTCVLAAFVARVAWYQHLELSVEADERASIISFLEHSAAGSDLPIVIGHPQRFLELSHDPPSELGGRLLHLSSPSLARRYIGTDSTEAGLLVLRRFAPLDVRVFERYEATRRPFLLLLTPDSSDMNWVVPALEADRRSLRPLAKSNGMTLLEVR